MTINDEWKQFEPILLPEMFDTGYDRFNQHLKVPNSGRDNMKLSFVKKVYRVFKYFNALSPIITSAYREKHYNISIGGAESSRHVSGDAVDIQFEDRFDKKACLSLYNFIDKTYPESGLGFYIDTEQDGRKSYFIHFDDRGYTARWGRFDGRYVTVNEVLKNG